jgi:hypothetical protein
MALFYKNKTSEKRIHPDKAASVFFGAEKNSLLDKAKTSKHCQFLV